VRSSLLHLGRPRVHPTEIRLDRPETILRLQHVNDRNIHPLAAATIVTYARQEQSQSVDSTHGIVQNVGHSDSSSARFVDQQLHDLRDLARSTARTGHADGTESRTLPWSNPVPCPGSVPVNDSCRSDCVALRVPGVRVDIITQAVAIGIEADLHASQSVLIGGRATSRLE